MIMPGPKSINHKAGLSEGKFYSVRPFRRVLQRHTIGVQGHVPQENSENKTPVHCDAFFFSFFYVHFRLQIPFFLAEKMRKTSPKGHFSFSAKILVWICRTASEGLDQVAQQVACLTCDPEVEGLIPNCCKFSFCRFFASH